MSESNFYDKLEILKKQFRDIPQNVLIFQLKESKGDLQQCRMRLNNEGFTSPTDNIMPELSAQRHDWMRQGGPVTAPHPYQPHPSLRSNLPNDLSPYTDRRMYRASPPPHYPPHGLQYGGPIPPQGNDQMRNPYDNAPPPSREGFRHSQSYPEFDNDSYGQHGNPTGSVPASVPYGGVSPAPGYDHYRNQPPYANIRSPPTTMPVSVPWQQLTPFEDKTLSMQRLQLQQIEKMHSDLQRTRSLMMRDVREKQIELSRLKRMNSQNSIDENEIYLVQSIKETLKDDIDRAKRGKGLDSSLDERHNWKCPQCIWVNNIYMSNCEKCGYYNRRVT
jgi:hypothetical protein